MQNAEVVSRAEEIKWADARDSVTEGRIEQGLQMARECQHRDARWLASLFPVGVPVTAERMHEVMLQQGDDPRALFIAWRLDKGDSSGLIRAAEAGYAPAQAELSFHLSGRSGEDEAFAWAQRSALQNDRDGLYQLGYRFEFGFGCPEDESKAVEAFRLAAELEFREAQYRYGELAFGEHDWERYHWWIRAKGRAHRELLSQVIRLLPLFERGEHGRILHIVGPVIANGLDAVGQWFGIALPEDEVAKLKRVIELHGAMLECARRAIDCWSMAARRIRVVKEMRAMIAKMLWEEPWQWGEKESARHETNAKRG
jgi:TPR repeat protein